MTDDTDDICGSTDTVSGEPCQNPAGYGTGDIGPCWRHDPSHDGDQGGRPKAIGEREQELVLTAVRAGLHFYDQANFARVSDRTLRRRLCCVETPRTPVINVPDPCEFCQDYVHAHSDGAINVLEQCRPEFRAAATFGYHETKEKRITGPGGGAIQLDLSEELIKTGYSSGD